MKKVYLAGFDVFRPDASEYGKRLKDLCKKYGLEGLYPLDHECTTAEEIFHANIMLIRQCDVMAANMNVFRGMEPDSGTAFELGVGYALGKKLYCYTDDIRSLREKIGMTDEQGFSVEDFSLPLNLMIAVPASVLCGGAEECLRVIAAAEE